MDWGIRREGRTGRMAQPVALYTFVRKCRGGGMCDPLDRLDLLDPVRAWLLVRGVTNETHTLRRRTVDMTDRFGNNGPNPTGAAVNEVCLRTRGGAVRRVGRRPGEGTPVPRAGP